ncbi:MAG TPA: diguanylate cyclase [Anaeromyxobacteraceae bacterium]|nr:diguanylate cyclase [Anaeromyxobacteraceae bacterium]
MNGFRRTTADGGGTPPAPAPAGERPPSRGDLDLLCREISERARDLLGRARLLGAAIGTADEPLARLLEEDARALAELAEEVLATSERASPSVPGHPPPPPAPPRPAASLPALLLADDDREHRETLQAVLERDYAILAVAGGDEALVAARAHPPDILLLDVRMPGLDGVAVLEALRAEAATVEVPVILLSGNADDVTRVRALDLGAADFLQKPVSIGELRARIDRTLRLTRRQKALRTLAQTDALTGLANLRAFRARLEEEVRRARRYGTPLTCIMADMDQLKPVNDELGHAAGDRAIAAVADVLRSELRTTDLGARYGGDEFVLLLPHTSAAEGHVLAERLCARLAATSLEAFGRSIPLRASFGVAEMARADETPGELVRRADEALYRAKRGGRGRVSVHAGPEATDP